jgi:hypothetical protein
VVQISAGPANPPASNQLPGTSVPVLQIQATNPSGQAATLASVQLTAAGSGNDATGINSVSLYIDANNNGIVDGGDTLLTIGTYLADDGTVTLNANTLIGPFGTVNYLVVYNFSASAPAGSYQANVTANTSLTGTSASGQPLAFTGAPIGGSFTAVAAATATATSTGTPSPTATVTATSQVPIIDEPVVFPNPADGTQPVNLQIDLSQTTGGINVQVFTIAFRKVQEMSLDGGSPGVTASAVAGMPYKKWTVPLPLTDKWGAPLASGIYYVVITANGKRSVGKLLVIR